MSRRTFLLLISLFFSSLLLSFTSAKVEEEDETEEDSEEEESEEEESEEEEDYEESVDMSEVSPTSALQKLVEIEDEIDFPAREILLYMIYRYEEEVSEEPKPAPRFTTFDHLSFAELYSESFLALPKFNLVSQEDISGLQASTSFPASLSKRTALTFSKQPGGLSLQIYVSQDNEAKALESSNLVGERWQALRDLAKKWTSTTNPLYLLVSSLVIHLPISTTPATVPTPTHCTLHLRPYTSFFFNKEEISLFSTESVYDQDTTSAYLEKLFNKILPRPFPDSNLKGLVSLANRANHRISMVDLTVPLDPQDNLLQVTFEIGDGTTNPEQETDGLGHFLHDIAFPGNAKSLIEDFSSFRQTATFILITFVLEEGKIGKEVQIDLFTGEYLSAGTPSQRAEKLKGKWTEIGKALVARELLKGEELEKSLAFMERGSQCEQKDCKSVNQNIARFRVHFDGEKSSSAVAYYSLDTNPPK